MEVGRNNKSTSKSKSEAQCGSLYSSNARSSYEGRAKVAVKSLGMTSHSKCAITRYLVVKIHYNYRVLLSPKMQISLTALPFFLTSLASFSVLLRVRQASYLGPGWSEPADPLDKERRTRVLNSTQCEDLISSLLIQIAYFFNGG